jgi:hypothetical protein
MDKARQRKRRNLATGGVANLIHFTVGRVEPVLLELTPIETLKYSVVRHFP